MQKSDKEYFFYFETNKVDENNFLSYYFQNPVKIIRLESPEDIIDFFNELIDLTTKYYVAGFFSYEFGYLLEEALDGNIKTSFPFAFFCAYEDPIIFDHKQGKYISGDYTSLNKEIPSRSKNYKISNLKLNVTEKEYKDNIKRIREHIEKGDIYQANYTIKYKFDFEGSSEVFYEDLKRKQCVAYNVFAKFDDTQIISLTPELFFRKRGSSILVKPMKGTYKRGRNILEDNENREFLRQDEKNQSENIMIVDLLRNDIGKVSEGGSVKVSKLYEVEKYNTLFQMTSTIESALRKNVAIYELIKSIFPSGSITGAPKIRSMEILRGLEIEKRNIYTGSIGFFEPSGDAIFNVAIRTILIDGNKGEMGIGGGIVYDSTADGEFQECKLKANFLLRKPGKDFSLIETVLLQKEYDNIDLHIKRMRESAEYFDYKFNEFDLLQQLEFLKQTLSHGSYKVRILLNRFGEIDITETKLSQINNEYRIILSKERVNSKDIYFFHKTTNRDLFVKELDIARENGFFDIIFLNEKEQITEGSITNVYAKINGIMYTPPIECGLLNGTARERMLQSGDVIEKIIYFEDLCKAETVYISNSIIGFKKAIMIHAD